MIRTQLPGDEARQREAALRRATDRELRDRLRIVPLAHHGRKHLDLARDLGCTPRTVQRWLHADLDRRLPGLRPQKARGAEAPIPATPADDVRRSAIGGPAAPRLDRANWTHAELADHLRKRKRLHVSRAATGRFCRKVGIRVYRPSYRHLRGPPQKQAQAGAGQAELRKGPGRGTSSA
jgi:transposase